MNDPMFGCHNSDARLPRADTNLLLDYSLPPCAWRAWRRGPEGTAFWRWVFT